MNEMQDFYRAFFVTAPIGVTVFDDECNPVDCNDVMLDMIESSKSYYLSRFFEFFPDKQPDGSDSREKFVEYLIRATTGERLQMKWTYCNTNDEQIPCSVTLSRLQQDDGYVNLVYVFDLRNIKEHMPSAEDGYIDALTGAYNRRYLGENLNGLISFLSRAKSTLTVMLIGLDNFSDFVNTHGQHNADVCIKTVADALKKNLTRTGDYVVRYSDTMFAVVLPNTDESGAHILSERLMEAMQCSECCALVQNSSGEVFSMSFSIGVATSKVKHTQVGGDYVRRADEMLKKSRSEGSNKFNCAKV